MTSRSLSSGFRSAYNAAQSADGILVLITLDHDSLADPIRVSSDGANTISRGNTFISYPFDLTFPDDEDDHAPRAHLVIDNVSQAIVRAVRSITGPLEVLIEVVLFTAPDSVEMSFPNFKIRVVDSDILTVEGELILDDYTSEPYPGGRFIPSKFPGIF